MQERSEFSETGVRVASIIPPLLESYVSADLVVLERVYESVDRETVLRDS